MKKAVVFIILLMNTALAWEWEHYMPGTSGIPDIIITSMAVAPDNSVWFGTLKGVVKYSAQKFTVYTSQNSNLPSDSVFSVCIDRSRKPYCVWAGTDSGAAYFDGATWYVFHSYESGGDDAAVSIAGDYVTALYADETPEGTAILFGTENGLCRYDYKKWVQIRLTSQNVFYSIKDIKRLPDGKLALASCGTGVFVISGDTVILLDERDGLKSKNVQCIIPSSDGSFYVGTDSGMFKHDGIKNFSRVELPGMFMNAEINSGKYDVKGRLWIATDRGLLIQHPDHFETFEDEPASPGLNNFSALDIVEYSYYKKIGVFCGGLNQGLYVYRGFIDEERNLYEEMKQRALSDYSARRRNKAYPALLELLKKSPEDIDVLYALGTLYYEDNQYNRAYDFFTRILKYDSIHKGSYFMLGRIYMNMQLYREARIQFNNLLDIEPNSIEGFYNIGKIYMLEHEYTKAIQFFRQVLDFDNTHYPAYMEIVNAYETMGLNFSAISYYKMLKTVRPKDITVYIALARLYLKENIVYEAAREIRDALDIEPNNYIAHTMLARIMIKGKQYAQARQHLDIAINIKRNDSFVRTVNGEYYNALRMTDMAVSEWQQAQATDPGNALAAFMLGKYLYSKSEYEKAMKEFLIVVDREPANYEARYYLGICYQAQMLYVLAVEEYKKVKALYPKFSKIQDINLRLESLKDFQDIK